jgi:hypothetical protein
MKWNVEDEKKFLPAVISFIPCLCLVRCFSCYHVLSGPYTLTSLLGAVWEVFLKLMWWYQASIKGHNKREKEEESPHKFNFLISFLIIFFIIRLFVISLFRGTEKEISIDSTRRSFYGKFKIWKEWKEAQKRTEQMRWRRCIICM